MCWCVEGLAWHHMCTIAGLPSPTDQGVQSVPRRPCRRNNITSEARACAGLQVLPAIADVLAPSSQLILLIKPQFEAARLQARAQQIMTAGRSAAVATVLALALLTTMSDLCCHTHELCVQALLPSDAAGYASRRCSLPGCIAFFSRHQDCYCR